MVLSIILTVSTKTELPKGPEQAKQGQTQGQGQGQPAGQPAQNQGK
jgi:hypothetical protein